MIMIKLIAFILGIQLFVPRAYCYPITNLEEKKCNETHYYWKIKSHPKDAYLLGSIHAPYQKVWQNGLPSFIEEQLIKSDIIYLELDLLSEEIQSKALSCQLLPDGKHLKSVINENLYRRIELFFRLKRIQDDDKVLFDLITKNWSTKRPVWLWVLINFLISNQSKDYKILTVDNFINLKGRVLNKQIRSIEDFDDQCGPLNNMDKDLVSEYLNFSLDDYFNKPDRPDSQLNFDHLIDQYRCGNLNSSSLLSIGQNIRSKWDSGLKVKNTYFQNQMIYQRNVKMSERINSELKKNEDKNLFFVMGTGHFLPEEHDDKVNNNLNDTQSKSVLEILETKFNHRIEQVNKINVIRR